MSDSSNNDETRSGGLYAPSTEGEVHTYDATDEKGSPRPMLMLGVLLLLAAFGGVLYIAYEQGMKESVRPPPPVLTAENTPIKTAPEQPGGMAIPHQDKTVYDQITGDSSEPPLEQLLPQAEEPMRIPPAEAEGSSPSAQALAEAAPEMPAPAEEGIAADVEILPPAIELPLPEVATAPAAPVMVEQPAAPSSEATAPIVETTTPTADAAAPSTEAAVPQTEPPAEEPTTDTAADTPAAEPVTATTAVVPTRPEPQVIETPETALGTHLVQIAAFRDQAIAETRFRSLQSKYPDLLSDLSPDIQRADLGAKGIYYRLRVGPFSGKDPASQLCSQLKTRGQDCLVRSR